MYTGNQDINFKVKDDVSSKYEKDDEIINASETQLVPKLPPASSSSSSESTSGEENCPSTRDARYVPAIGDVFIPLNVNATLSPSFTLLVFYVRDDRETIADSQKILVEKCFNNKVNFQFKDAVKQPGTPTSIQVSSSPNSLCGIKVVDKSISLLDNSDQLTKTSSDLCEQNKPQPGLQSSELSSKVHPSDSWHSSSYEDSYAAFQEAGFLVISNFVLFSRPCADNGGDDYDDYITGEYLTGEYETAEYDAVSGGEPIKPHKHKRKISSLKSAVDVRNYFPETWLFQLQMTGPDGIFKAKETLPHTITEWEGSAVCINSQDGLGLSNVTSIRGFQPFFISYNLPISVIRGEEFVVVVTIFSYADAALPISVTLDQPKGFEVVSDLKNSNLCIEPSSSESLPITLKATAVGSVNITVRAQTATSDKVCGSSPTYDGLARDAITQSFEVEAEGFANEKSHSILFCPSDEENQKFSKSFDLTLPDDAVPDSQRAFVDVTGNVMGPSIQNLNNLVSLPTGCGEQNMVKFTPNYLVLDYLTDIGKLTDNIKSEAITNLNTGYQRELNYRHFDGSFSAFGENDNEGSMFLTAFVLRSFYEAKRYILIDDVVLKDAQKWITGKQRSDGCFPNIGQIIDSGIKGGLEKDQNNGTITAYVVASLLISKYHNQTVINNAISCLQKDNPLNPYETFMYAYALALQGRKSDASSLIDQMKPFANNTDGVEYYRNPGSTKSTDIETAAYAVLTNLKVGNSKSDILPLIRYLTMNMNPYGGFHSTQDTCVGLDAISRFAKIIYKDPVNIALSISGGLEEQLKITEDNKILVQRNKVSQVPSELDIEATGSGCGLLQTSLRFNTVTPPEKRKFDLQITGECTNSDCTERSITTLVSYKPDGKKSGMSVVQIKMITGTVADKDSLDKLTDDEDSNILRTEVENNKVNIYFSEISNDVQQFSFDVKEIIKVNNPQPGTAKVFDYYAPEYSTSTTYTFGK